MKKGRPGHVIHALVAPDARAGVVELLLEESTSLGVRTRPWERDVLDRWTEPLDTECIESFAKKVKVVCTLEDHVLCNGFGCGVVEHLSDAGIKTTVVRVGWPDEFIEHGSVPILRKKHGLTVEGCVEKVLTALGMS